jgi:hypothetical protein
MKRILLLITLSLSSLFAISQKYEDMKNKLIFNNYKESRKELDIAMTNAKFASNAEAYILKTTIYAALAMDSATRLTPESNKLTEEADAAFAKYREMQPDMSLTSDPIYRNGPINLYNSWYSLGYNDYRDKKWDAGFEKFKKVVAYAELLIGKKLIDGPVNTDVLILAGITAEKSNHKDEAAGYYGRLADTKMTGEGFESVYRFLVTYYFGKKDYTSFEKYKSIGKELYPKSDFFSFDKIDFAVGLETTLTGKVKAVEEVLAKDPDNYKANEWMGEIIYRAFHPLKDDAAEPFDSAAMEIKMIAAFNKAAASHPDSIDAYLFLGDHFYDKSEKINEQRKEHVADMQKRTKPGTMASKEDIAKRDLLDKQYGDALEAERIPYEKGAAIFATRTTLTIREKAQYRLLTGKIADIYTYKKKQVKNKQSPEFAKYEAEEKKWNDRYESIK